MTLNERRTAHRVQLNPFKSMRRRVESFKFIKPYTCLIRTTVNCLMRVLLPSKTLDYEVGHVLANPRTCTGEKDSVSVWNAYENLKKSNECIGIGVKQEHDGE